MSRSFEHARTPASRPGQCSQKSTYITLREVQVAHCEVGAGDEDREPHLRADAEVLDVAVAAMLTPRDRPRALLRDLLEHVGGQVLPDVDALGERRERDGGRGARVSFNQSLLAAIPLVEELLRRCSADDARVGDAGEAHARDVAARGEPALEVPDRLARPSLELAREKPAVLLLEDACEEESRSASSFREECVLCSSRSGPRGWCSAALGPLLPTGRCAPASAQNRVARERVERTGVAPRHLLVVLDVEDLDDERVAGLCSLDRNGTREEVDLREVDVADVVGVIRVLDLAARPFVAPELEDLALLDGRESGDVGVPAVHEAGLALGGLERVDGDEHRVRSHGW